MDQLRRAGAVRVSELAREFDVAELTIRRDIGALADRGLLTRVHGGATLRSPLDTSIPKAIAAPGPPLFRVGMVVPSLSYYWPQVIIGARAAATSNGVQLVLRGASYAVEDQRRQIASLIESGSLHGLIAAPQVVGPDGHTLLHWLASLPIPVVLAERSAPSVLAERTHPSALALTRLEWVTTDHVFGGSLAAEHLASLRHSRVGIVTATDSPTSLRLRRGWFRAVDELGLENRVDIDVSLDAIYGAEREAVIERIVAEFAATGISAVLIHSDPHAVMVQQYARDHGIAVPEDLAIIAYDDEVAESAEPPITALRPPKQHIGRLAVETMVARLREGPARPPQRIFVVPALHRRGSTGRHEAPSPR